MLSDRRDRARVSHKSRTRASAHDLQASCWLPCFATAAQLLLELGALSQHGLGMLWSGRAAGGLMVAELLRTTTAAEVRAPISAVPHDGALDPALDVADPLDVQHGPAGQPLNLTNAVGKFLKTPEAKITGSIR